MDADSAAPALSSGVKRGRDVAVTAQPPKRPRREGIAEGLDEQGGPSHFDGVAGLPVVAEVAASCSPAEAFVVANSEVVKTALQDEPSASWLLAFPPSFTADAAAWERTLSHLAVLEQLHAEEPAEWMRILQVRTRPMYASISGCSAEDLAELLHLTEYLQLPKQLAARLGMRAEILRLGKRLRSVFTGDEMMSLLESSAALKPAVAIAKEKLEAPLDDVDGIWMSSVHDGACGFLCDAYPDDDELERLERLVEEDEDVIKDAADKVGSYVVGQLLVGTPAIRDVPRVMRRRSGAPAAVAAYHADIPRLNELAALGWSLCSVPTVGYARNSVPVLEWWDGDGIAAFFADAGAGAEFDFEGYDAGQRLAAARGCLSALRWTVETGNALELGLDAVAVEAGHWGSLLFLREAVPHYPRSERACAIAAGAGDLPMLQYLASQGDRLGKRVVVAAIAHGYTDVLEYLRAQGAPFPEPVCRYAAMWGQLETLQWLRAQDPPYPWSAATIEAAEGAGFYEVAAWARAHGCPEPAAALAASSIRE
jgi:hypothetical protein